VLRRIFGPKKDEVTEEWRRLHNKELYALYSSQNIFCMVKLRRLGWAGHVARMGQRRGTYRILEGKREGRRPFSFRFTKPRVAMNLQTFCILFVLTEDDHVGCK
jgi:hypothetical protein